MKLLLYFVAAFTLPPAIIILRNGDVIEVLPMLLSSAGFALLLFSLINILKKVSTKVAAVMGVILLLGALLIRYLLGFLYDFSGRGFSAEFFAHVNRTSMKLGLQEYDHEAWVALIVFSAFAYIAVRLINSQRELATSSSIGLLLIAGLLIYIGASASPELQLAQAYSRYSQFEQDDQRESNEKLRQESSTLLKNVQLMRSIPIEKSQLKASLPEKQLNLILIYLESFNESLMGSKRYPGLTPQINSLKSRYHSFDQIYSSGYVTIEGIANSQCGTLMNMDYANSSLITRKGRLPQLPCLGDILQSAGYDQTYLGGAELDFAGKGAFFREHGYNRVLGWKHWADLGFQRYNDWGLSDTILFDQAFKTILEYHQQGTLFNVTLLTLGTHTPGYVYDGCPVYTRDTDKPYVNAFHCTDFLLGQFVEKLEQNGILDDSVLFIQADHGSFITPFIMKQFGKEVADTRLLTILALPDSVQTSPDNLRENAEGTNLNTVATLLDVLNISHNTGFIFAKSHFDSKPDQNYYLTRRQDYANKKRFETDRYRCKQPDRITPPTLPLDNCDKKRVMQAVYALNSSYSRGGNIENRVCELAAEIGVESDSGKVEVKWGNQNLSDQFYRRGTKRVKKQTEGVYAVIFDAQNNVTQSLFFDPGREEDMRDIQDLYVKAIPGQRMLLIRNIDMASLAPNIDKMWPAQLRDQSIVYGIFDDGQLAPEFVSTDTLPNSRFIPSSCSSDKT